MSPESRLPEILLGIGLVALGLFFAVETTAIKVAPIYAKVGPTVFPWIVAGALVALGVLFALQAWRRGQHDRSADPVPGRGYPPTPPAPPSDWRALAVISVALLLQVAFLRSLGFVITAAILFMAVTYAFGSRQYLRNTIIAVLLAVIVYAGFTRGLNLQLPAGVLGI